MCGKKIKNFFYCTYDVELSVIVFKVYDCLWLGVRVRAATMGILYRKVLRLRNLRDKTVGEVTLMVFVHGIFFLKNAEFEKYCMDKLLLCVQNRSGEHHEGLVQNYCNYLILYKELQ